LRNILTEPKNSIIKQYVKLMAMDGVELSFDDDTLEYIVDMALEYKLGARGLRSIVETIMMEKMYEVPSGEEKVCVITKEYAKGQIDKSAALQGAAV
jgi:ATP-dependent Clp protease ATP-binding subunit ClpX